MFAISGNTAKWAIAFGLAFVTAFGLFPQSAYGQGMNLTERFYEIPEERLPLRLSLNVTHDTNPDDDIVSTIQISLFESKSDEVVQGVVYALRLVRLDTAQAGPSEGNSSSESSDIALSELFFAQNGSLTLVLAEGDGPAAIENGVQENEFRAWVANDSMSAPLTLRSPQISEGSTYSFQAEILTIDDVKNHIALEDVPRAQFTIDTGEDLSSSVAVVPEFPVGPFLIVGLVLVIIVAYQKLPLLRRQFL